MQVTNKAENLMYDDSDSRCGLWLAHNGRELCAFVQALDIGNPGNRHPEPFKKRYWGPYDESNPEQSIQQIMANGAKWPELPA